MPCVAEGETPDEGAIRVQALKKTKRVDFPCLVFRPILSGVLRASLHRAWCVGLAQWVGFQRRVALSEAAECWEADAWQAGDLIAFRK